MRKHHRDLTPAQGRQDHTISPSASCHSSDNTTRPSHPALHVRDDRDTPLLVSTGRADARSDLPDNARAKIVTPWHDGQFAHGVHAHDARSPSSRERRAEYRKWTRATELVLGYRAPTTEGSLTLASQAN